MEPYQKETQPVLEHSEPGEKNLNWIKQTKKKNLLISTTKYQESDVKDARPD